jgi:pilus assembly protein CpaF
MLPQKSSGDKSSAGFIKKSIILSEGKGKMSQILGAVSDSVRDRSVRSSANPRTVFDAALDAEIEARAGLLPLGEEMELRQSAENHLFGFGKLQPLLDDPEIEEIWINGPSKVFVAKSGKASKVQLELDSAEISGLVERMLRPTGRRLDRSSPFVDAALPDGSRLHVVIPDITSEYWSVNIRKFPQRILGMDDLVAAGSLSANAAAFLVDRVRSGANVLVSGATQAGKTTLLCALIDALEANERIITVEETFEIRAKNADWVAMQTRQPNLEGKGEISLRRLIKESLRMRPSRLIVGEVREAEALDLLIALNSGLPGLCTVHANSALDALLKICTLPLLAGSNISMDFIGPTVAACIDFVVHCSLNADGTRSVSEIRVVTGFNGSITSEVVIP